MRESIENSRVQSQNSELPAVVLGGGGAFGIAYELGIYKSLQVAGVDLRNAQILGTSAGSWAAGCIATGRTFEELSDMRQVKVPNWKPGLLQGITREVFGEERATNVRAMAVKVKWPMLRPTKLSGHEHPLADMVAASSAVPGLFRPVRIGDNEYYDGGIRSIVSADIAPKGNGLLAIAVLGRHFMPPIGRVIEGILSHEMSKWGSKHDGDVTLIRPNREINELIRTPRDIFDFEVAKKTYELARIQGEKLIQVHPGVAALVIRLSQSGQPSEPTADLSRR